LQVHTRPDALLGAGKGKSLQVAGLLVACLQGAVMQAFTSASNSMIGHNHTVGTRDSGRDSRLIYDLFVILVLSQSQL
jgi:hypothetical protein